MIIFSCTSIWGLELTFSTFSIDNLCQADEIFIQAIKDAGIYDSIWQAFAVFMPVLTVGVQGDQRTHSYAITLRAVTSQDGMTADWYIFSSRLTISFCYIIIIVVIIDNCDSG